MDSSIVGISFVVILSKHCVLVLLRKDDIWSCRMEIFEKGISFISNHISDFSHPYKTCLGYLKAVLRLGSLIELRGGFVIIWRIFFVIKRRRDLVEGKNDLLPTSRSIIFSNSNGSLKYSWLICHECKAKKYKAMVSDLIWPCSEINDPMIFPTSYSLSVYCNDLVTGPATWLDPAPHQPRCFIPTFHLRALPHCHLQAYSLHLSQFHI